MPTPKPKKPTAYYRHDFNETGQRFTDVWLPGDSCPAVRWDGHQPVAVLRRHHPFRSYIGGVTLRRLDPKTSWAVPGFSAVNDIDEGIHRERAQAKKALEDSVRRLVGFKFGPREIIQMVINEL